MPQGLCEGVGWAVCLERSHRRPRTWESHVAPTRAALELLRGVRGTSSSVAGVPGKSAGAGVLPGEAGPAPRHVSPPDTPSWAPTEAQQQEAQERMQPCCFSQSCPPLGEGSEP